jgi:hypothetical protein
MYKLLPFYFTRILEKEVLVNEIGDMLILPSGSVKDIIEKKLNESNELYKTLHANFFISDEILHPLYEVYASRLAAKKRNFESYPNVLDLESNTESTILNYPKDDDESVFYQITSCSGKEIKYTISNAYDKSTIVPTTTIAAGKLNYFAKFDNVFGETKLQLTGTTNDQIFVKHNGISKSYTPSVKSSIKLSFDQSNNAIIFPRPTEKSERFKYTVYIGKEGELSSKHLTICSFVYKKELDNVYKREF